MPHLVAMVVDEQGSVSLPMSMVVFGNPERFEQIVSDTPLTDMSLKSGPTVWGYRTSIRMMFMCVFIKLHITAQPSPVKLIFQCYSNGSALDRLMCEFNQSIGQWGIIVYVFITLTDRPPT